MMKALSLFLIIFASVFVGYMICELTTEPEVIVQRVTYSANTTKLLDYIREGKQSHQEIIYNPEWIQEGWGDIEFHKMWVERYNELEDFIIEVIK